MKKVIFAAVLAMLTVVAQAGSRQDLESSAIVQGTIVLATDGTVQTAVIDDEASVGKPIADMVREAALQWRFQPVERDGRPVLAKASMHVRVVLKKTSDGNYSARIKGATFGDGDKSSTDTLRAAVAKNISPSYPEVALRARVQGTVYLALHVDHDGHVFEAVAEQVNLDNTGPNRVLKQFREILGDAAVKAARKWSYVTPTTGKLAKRGNWTARLPVTFRLSEAGRPVTESVWQTYLPGPYTPAPWIHRPDMDGADALADGAVQTEGAGPTLLAPLKHG
jgi:hypothetical protein